MKGITLIYDPAFREQVEEQVVPAFGPHLKIKYRYEEALKLELTERDFIVCYLSDEQLKVFLPQVSENHWKIGFLPHPKMDQARQGFGVEADLERGIEHLLASEEVFSVDMLLANEVPVFNTLALGNTLSVMYSAMDGNRWQRFVQRMRNLGRVLKQASLHAIALDWENDKEQMREKPIETAALGMVVVQHGASNLLSRRILENSAINDGMMHSLVLAPKSFAELLGFTFSGLLSARNSKRLPNYVAHIKTNRLIIHSAEGVEFSLDDRLMTAKEVELVVKRKALDIVPGRLLRVEKRDQGKKVFKTQALPTGELRKELISRKLPLTRHATTDEFKGLFTTLRDNAQLTPSYLVLMALSTIIATFGLFGDSSPVIIGAMILAPLMSPIISLGMGVLRQDTSMVQNSIRTIGFGMLIGYAFAVVITWFTPLNTLNAEISARIRPNLLDLGVAAASGIAGAYAHAKEEVAKTLAGVAIAVALVPPLAVSGIGLGWGDPNVFGGALLLLATNLAGMVLAAAVTFLILGFSPFGLAKKGILLSLFLVLVISTPLAFGFSKMVKENKLVQQLSSREITKGVIRDVRVRNLRPLSISFTLVTEKPLRDEELPGIREEVIEVIGEEAELELRIGILLDKAIEETLEEDDSEGEQVDAVRALLK
ncbi:MAG: DUF389 domain-containing protein [Nitritalea sp.]